MNPVQLKLKIQVVGTFSRESPRHGVNPPYSNEKLHMGQKLYFEMDDRESTTDPTGCIMVFSYDNDLYYGHVISPMSIMQHTQAFHARYFRRLQELVPEVQLEGTVINESNRSRKGWPIEMSIRAPDEFNSIIREHMAQLNDLFID